MIAVVIIIELVPEIGILNLRFGIGLVSIFFCYSKNLKSGIKQWFLALLVGDPQNRSISNFTSQTLLLYYYIRGFEDPKVSA